MERWTQIIRLLLITVGAGGAVLFFPISFGDQFTCLYHRLTCEMEETSPLAQFSQGEKHSHDEHEIHNASLNTYIAEFSLFWWGSIALLVIGLYYTRIMRYGKRLWKGLRDEL